MEVPILSGPSLVKKSFLTQVVLNGLTILLFGLWNPSFIPFVCGIVLLATPGRPVREKAYSGWAKVFLCAVGVILTLIALFNFAVDPLWCFGHVNPWNMKQAGFNERLLKTNLVTFGDFRYRSLLIGSSRVAVLNQNDFKGMDAFNYAAATMVPEEYGEYIRYAAQRKGKGFENIIIGMDFFGSNGNYRKTFEPPDFYFDTAGSMLYRYRMLLAWDTLRYSMDNLRGGGGKVRGTYDRCNVRTPKPRTFEERKRLVREQFIFFKTEGYGKNYRYDENLKEKLVRLKLDNPGASFMVFTTPVSEPLFCLMIRMNRLPDYERWLRDLVQVFGRVWNFMDLNTVTRDHEHTFTDLDHVYPATGRLIAHRVLGIRDENVPPDFGKLVTRDNIDEIIAEVRSQCAECGK